MANDIFSVAIRDFQSIKTAKFEFVNGINIITGKSNAGKSAVFRAIDCALFNIGDDDLVRSGCRKAGVQINNGSHELIFMRDAVAKNEKTSYVFDGGSIQKKVGRTQLSETASLFRITDVRMNNNVRMKLNFWYQADKPFLSDKTAGQLYEFLSLSSCDRYAKIIKRMAADIKIQEAVVAQKITAIETLEYVNGQKQEFIERNAGFDTVYAEVLSADRAAEQLETVRSGITHYTELQQRIDSLRKSLAQRRATMDAIPLDTFKGTLDALTAENLRISKIGGQVSQYITWQYRAVHRETAMLKSKTLTEWLHEKVQSLQQFINQAETRFNALVNTASGIKRLKTAERRHKDLKQEVVRKRRYIEILPSETLTALESRITQLLRIDGHISAHNIAEQKVSRCRDSRDAMSLTLSDVSEQFEQFKREVKICPLCGSSLLDPSHA